MRVRRTVALVALARGGLSALGPDCLAETGPPSNSPPVFATRTWTADHGLPQNTVQALCQTRDGFLWVGTRFGVARFDGVEFRAFRAANVPELAEASVSAIAEDGRGVLWVGTLDGLVRMEEGRFWRVTALDGRRVWAVWPAPDGSIWCGLNEGLARWKDNLLESVPLPADTSGRVRSLAPLPDNGLLVTTLAEWLRFDLRTRAFTPWLPPEWPPDGPESRLTASTAEAWRSEPLPVHSPAELARAYFAPDVRSAGGNDWGPRMTADGAGGWWAVNTRRQLYHLGARRPVRIAPGRDDVFSEVLCAAEDREGNVWLGTAVAGLTRLRARRLEHFQLGDGEEAACFTVGATAAGVVWAAAKTRLLRWEAGRVESYSLPFAQPVHQIFSLLPEGEDTLWLARDRAGLFRWQAGVLEDFSQRTGVVEERLRVLARTRDGALWVGGRSGLVRWDGTNALRWGASEGLPHPDVRAIHEDRAGRLWVATHGGGVAVREGAGFRAITTRDGLSHDVQWGFLEDGSGALWIYGQQGLTRVRGASLAVVTSAHGLFDDLTNQMLEDDAGDFWLGCNRGLYRVRGEDLHAVADGRRATVECAVFGAEDGLPVAETNGENQPAGARAADGALWIPTPVGVVRVVPALVPRREVPPPLSLEYARTEVLSLYEQGRANPELRRAADGALRLPPGTARIVDFRFTAPSFAAPERVRFRHRLVGYGTNWIEAGSRRETHYTNLRPGRYRFEFTACNDHGVWNPEPAAFAFELAPHFWETRGFPAVLAGAALLGGWGLHRLRLRLIRRRLALENELGLARERERIARDMHDDVGAGLTQIGLLTERAARTGADELPPLLDRIAEASREAAQSMDEIVWAVNPRNDRLEHLANYVCQFAREYLEPTGLRCRLEVPALLPDLPVPSDVRHHLLMALKESLNNAVRHAAATEVTVELHWADGSLRLAVTDNGRGFAAEVPAHPRPGGGNGLANLRRRAEAIGGRCVIESRPGHGTRVELGLRLQGAAR